MERAKERGRYRGVQLSRSYTIMRDRVLYARVLRIERRNFRERNARLPKNQSPFYPILFTRRVEVMNVTAMHPR